MKECLAKQKSAFLKHPYPSKQERIAHLQDLKQALLDNEQAICDAISADFGHRSPSETRFVELMSCVGDINYTIGKIGKWMKPERRGVGLQFMPASNKIMYQPLGVIGIIVPWNYPLYLSIAPLTAALAAGNRAMIKMSEFTPNFNKVLIKLIEEIFKPNLVKIVEGEADVAAQFSALPFDHILFTGSTAVGKHVMRAAAENLTPVTLELGGKSPAIIDDKINIKTAAKQILFGKCVNSGQTCVAPDYVLCPKDKVEQLTQALSEQFNKFYPDFDQNSDYTHVVNDRQYDRIQSWLDEAANANANIISTTDKPYTDYKDGRRKLPLQMVLDADESLNVMQQEIFGPVMPIIPYNNLDEAISYVQERPRPLALYIHSFSKRTQEHILTHTHAGGVTINDTVLHFGQKDMPVGGVGPSGMGMYHGVEGFKTFSSAKGIHAKGKINSVEFIHPPYEKSLLKLVLKLFMR